MPRPDFLIVGAPKAGTTALYAALSQHPRLYFPAVKEPKFFLCDERPPRRQHGPGDAHSVREWVWRRTDYERLFAAAPAGAVRGEATPLYLADEAAHGRIRDTWPDMKLIAVLRDPIERAYVLALPRPGPLREANRAPAPVVPRRATAPPAVP